VRVSFDLAVWFDPAPITHEQAAATYGILCDTEDGAAPTQPQVAAFYQELTTRFPDLRGSDDSPWATDLTTTPTAVVLTIVWSRANEIAEIIDELAMRHGLVCHDPQIDITSQPRMHAGQITLECSNGSRSVEPGPASIEQALRRLSRNNWYAILERSEDWWVQVGDGATAGTREGWYALERRDGSADQQYRANVADLDKVITAFQRFAQGDESWIRGFSWLKITV
jgi:hypothetical protein